VGFCEGRAGDWGKASNLKEAQKTKEGSKKDKITRESVNPKQQKAKSELVYVPICERIRVFVVLGECSILIMPVQGPKGWGVAADSKIQTQRTAGGEHFEPLAPCKKIGSGQLKARLGGKRHSGRR